MVYSDAPIVYGDMESLILVWGRLRRTGPEIPRLGSCASGADRNPSTSNYRRQDQTTLVYVRFRGSVVTMIISVPRYGPMLMYMLLLRLFLSSVSSQSS